MNIQDYLRELSKNYKPTSILDIGAHQGEFSKFCKSLWKDVDLLMLEGNDECESVLEQLPFDHCIVLLSDVNKEVTLYLNPKNLSCTGTSYYKERTRHYKESVEIIKNTYTLDEVIEEIDNKKYDIIKIDTQGSELDIIKGGLKTVQNCSYLIMEVSTLQYNEGSPLFDEIVEYMNSIGFSDYEVIAEHVWKDPNEDSFECGEIFQLDVVFEKLKN
jgi:FkbM family methyltransferase